MKQIQELVQSSISTKEAVLSDVVLLKNVQQAADVISAAFRSDKKVLFCGNGGSAADAQHLAAEFSGRYYFDRDPLFSEALHVNTSYVTAVANDYSYDQIYSRLVKAKGREGDVLVGMSTSGNSNNIVEAFKQGNANGMHVIAMTGRSGGRMKEHCDLLLNMPSEDTPRIQECHMLLGHIICQLVEEALFAKQEVA
ncbi:MAG: D-sedoheptulose 7-phosphate isomerase [Pseudomonadales bacterium]|nr:D-sedoheptulose 7-phosphate isomerase [Pseudomonadales bacterium]